MKSVILIPGLGSEMLHGLNFLDKTLRNNFTTQIFGYQSLTKDLETNSETLANYIQSLSCTPEYFVGVSLGGVLLHQALLHLNADTRNKIRRILLIGSPVAGHKVAQVSARNPFYGWVLGPARFNTALQQGVTNWPEQCELGMIAGTNPIGPGHLYAFLSYPNDGIVALTETRISRRHERLVQQIVNP